VPTNIDAMIKDKNGKLQPFDINGPSFIGWFEAEVGSFEGKQVVILGVGGVGEPIARMLSKRQPQEMFLVDVVSKQGLAEELGCVYSASLENVSDLSGEVVFINCAGKEGASEAGAEDFLKKYKARGNVFVDLRPHLDILIVEEAKYLGWKAYTGFGMNARNDYALLSKICELVGVNVLLFNDFKELVAGAS
jgi:shikimate 5-dehydrogenase